MDFTQYFTVEEINLICIYNTGSRVGILYEIENSMKFVYEPEMIEIMLNVIKKLKEISDSDFDKIDFSPIK